MCEKFKKISLRILLLVLAIITVLIIQLFFPHLFSFKKEELTGKEFELTSEITNYTAKVLLYSFAMRNSDNKKSSNVSKLEKDIKKANEKLNQALIIAKKEYGKKVAYSIDSFVKWQKNNDPIALLKLPKQRIRWYNEYSYYIAIIEMQLRQATGIYHVDDGKLALIMQLVPKAKENLIAHANDPKLCKIANNALNRGGPKKVAAQIAFIELGSQYCSDYYNKTSSWGNSNGIAPSHYVKTENPYYKLNYKKYYHQYVLPLVPNVIEDLQGRKPYLHFWCHRKGIMNYSDRDPLLDAWRAAYQIHGEILCKKELELPLEDKNYFNTGIFCMVRIDMVCTNPNGCDAVQRCKRTAN